MERVSKLINFPVDLVAEIEKYQKENYLSSFAAAVYELVRAGLETKAQRLEYKKGEAEKFRQGVENVWRRMEDEKEK